MTPCTCGHDMDGDADALLLFLISAALEEIFSASNSCDCERCAARAESSEDTTDEKGRGDEELGLFLAKRLLRDVQEDDDEDTRANGLSLLHSLLIEESGPPLSSASKLALMSLDTIQILAEAVQDQRIPSSCTAKGILMTMYIIQTDDDLCTFVDAMGGFQGLADWMKYHLDDAYTCGLICLVLSKIVQSDWFEDEASCWHSEGLVDLVVAALEMHLATSPSTFQMFIHGIPAAWPVLRPYGRRIRDCIMEAMSSHFDDQDCQRSGEEVLTHINGPLDFDLQHAVLEVAGEDNCSAAA